MLDDNELRHLSANGRFIYLASPYTNASTSTMYRRSEEAAEFVAEFYREHWNSEGLILLYSPIAYCAPLERNYGLPSEFEFWERIDTIGLNKCDAVWVLALDSLIKSRGVKREVEYAQQIKKPVFVVYKPFRDSETGGLIYNFDPLTRDICDKYGWKWLE